ncbi:hypothetical protein ES703_03776 [subsurface metagenome]
MAEERPEWDIFERLEKLEEIKLTAQDAAILATFGFSLAFYAIARQYSNPRELKDVWIAFLKRKDLSTKARETLEEWLLAICKRIEERRKD